MSNDDIFSGIVECRRKIYSPNKEDVTSIGRCKDVDVSLNWYIKQCDSDIADLKNQLLMIQKMIDEIQMKFILLHVLVGNLYDEQQEMLTHINEVRNELKSLKLHECVIHSNNTASIWKSSSS